VSGVTGVRPSWTALTPAAWAGPTAASVEHRRGARGARCDRVRGLVRARHESRPADAFASGVAGEGIPGHRRRARLGAMVAFEMVKDPKSKEPDAAVTAAIVAAAEKRGLILLSCGTDANVVRLLAPLTIPDAVLEEGLAF